MDEKPFTGCLLSSFIWIWIIVSAVGTFTAVTGLLGLPLYDQLKPDISIPHWALLPYAVTFLAYLISLLAIVLDKAWGLFIFIGATLAIVAIEVTSGIPLSESVYVLINVVVLVVLLSLDEWHSTSEADLVKFYREGLANEGRNPRGALKIYEHFEKFNVTYSLTILFVSLLSLPFAYVIAYYVNLQINSYQGFIAVVLMCLLGIGPVIFLSVRRRKRQISNEDVWRQSHTWSSRVGEVLIGIWGWGWMLVLALFADVIQLAFMILITGLVLILLMLPYNLWLLLQIGPPLNWGIPETIPEPTGNALTWSVFLIIFLAIASEVRLKPFSLGRILQEIPIGLKENSDKILSFITNIALMLVLLGAAVQYQVLYENLHTGIIVYLFLGALIGWDRYRHEKNHLLGTLNVISQSRCLLNLGYIAEARVKLQRRLETVESSLTRHPEAFKRLTQGLYMRLTGSFPPHIAQQQLHQAARALDDSTPYRDLCQRNIQLIE